MIGIIIAFVLGYWLGEKKESKQEEYVRDHEYTGKIEYNDMDYGYVRDGESVKDLT
jgi:hypothetical protein